jgi:hypothetical protein
MPEWLRAKQQELQRAVAAWQQSRSNSDLRTLKRLQKSYKNKFDEAQTEYQRIVQREVSRESGHDG